MSEERAPPEEAHVVRQGYLRRLKTMKRKYFVLKSESRENSARLEYYESDKKFRARAPPKRAIPLKTCFNINRRLDTKHKHVIALYTKEESFCVVLESEEELRAWLNALLSLHGEEGSDELQHPTQHVWSVNVQRKGLGASKHILGPYHLCLTDKTISLVKIKSNNNVLYDSYVPDLLEFSLKNIRRCGDSESFFYMEMGRLTVTGAGELWMLTDDSNIAQSMHTTILGAMSNCSKENCDKDLQPTLRDRSMSADEATKPTTWRHDRRQTHTGVKTGLSPSNEKRLCSGGMCVTSCIKPCVTSSASYCVDPPANTSAPNTPKPVSIKGSSNNASPVVPAESGAEEGGAPSAPRVSHARTRSLPLAGDADDSRAPVDRADHRSVANGGDSLCRARQAAPPAPPPAPAPAPAAAWLTRRASTGCRLAKWSPAHAKNTSVGVRNRCDSMPSRACPRDTDAERAPSRVPSQHLEDLGEVGGADEVDSAEWTPAAHRTPRIPEEPDTAPYCEMSASAAPRRIPMKISSTHHSRNSSLAEDSSPQDRYLVMVPNQDTGYVDMHGRRAASPAASGSSVASGTPSTDLRFSEYHLDPATSKILVEDDERPIPRAYSVGSRPAPAPLVRTPLGDASRTRAFSVGSKSKMRPLGPPPPPHASAAAAAAAGKTSSAPLLAPNSSDTLCDDLMELDFSSNQSPRTRAPALVPSVARTPPVAGFVAPLAYSRPKPTHTKDEYVDMSPSTPKGSGYVEMRPTERGLTPTSEPASLARSPPTGPSATPDGYVEMNYGKRTSPSRPILIFSNSTRPITNSGSRNSMTDSERSTPSVMSPQIYGRNGVINNNSRMKKMTDRQRRNSKDAGTPINAQTIFPFTLESPASPAKPFEMEKTELEAADVFECESSHYADIVGGNMLSTVREISEEGTRKSQESSPGCDYVTLKAGGAAAAAASRPIAARGKLGSQAEEDAALLSSNPTATKTMARESESAPRADDARPALVRAPSGPGGAARFAPLGPHDADDPPRKSSSPKPVESALNRALRAEAPPPPPPLIYASLDLEPRGAVPPPPPSPAPTSRAYTQIDFARSDQLNTVDSN